MSQTADSITLAVKAVTSALQVTTESITYLVDAFGAESVGEAFCLTMNFTTRQMAYHFKLANVTVGATAEIQHNLGVENEMVFEALAYAEYRLATVSDAMFRTLNVPAEMLVKWLVHNGFDIADI